MRSKICTYSVNISAGGALFLVTQIVTIENECKRLVFGIAFFVMSFSIYYFKLGENITETPVKYVLNSTGKTSISISA